MIANHVLVFGAAHSGKLRVCETIAGEKAPAADADSHSGVIVKTRLKNKYYSHNLSLFVDEFGTRHKKETVDELLASLGEWEKEFSSNECKELRDNLDGVVFTVDVGDSPEYIDRFVGFGGKLRDTLDAEYDEWPGFVIFVGVSDGVAAYEAVEDLVIAQGLEFLYLNEEGENEFKESIGKDRLREIFDTHEWKNIELETSDYEDHKIDKSSEMTASLLGGEQESQQIDADAADFTQLLGKLRLAKEEASKMSPEERKKYAQEVLDDVLDYI